MREFKCIWACGDMRRFITPLIWRNEEEDVEFVINASGLICDRCGAIAIDPREGKRIQGVIEELLTMDYHQGSGNTFS